MNDETDYRPIDCAVYSGYEVAIMHRDWLQVRWREPNGMDHIERLQPIDLMTRNKEEFMIAVNQLGHQYAIRLDRIMNAEPVEPSPIEGDES